MNLDRFQSFKLTKQDLRSALLSHFIFSSFPGSLKPFFLVFGFHWIHYSKRKAHGLTLFLSML